MTSLSATKKKPGLAVVVGWSASCYCGAKERPGGLRRAVVNRCGYWLIYKPERKEDERWGGCLLAFATSRARTRSSNRSARQSLGADGLWESGLPSRGNRTTILFMPYRGVLPIFWHAADHPERPLHSFESYRPKPTALLRRLRDRNQPQPRTPLNCPI